MTNRIVIAVLILYGFVVWALLYGDTNNLSERGDVKWQADRLISTMNSEILNRNTSPSSAASNVQPADAAEIYARMCDEYEPWTPPPVLRGNSFIYRLEHNPE